MNNKLRRQRSKNFSDEEEAELVKLVKANQLIIENKKSGALIWKQKEETWDKIALEYTRRTGMQRTTQALKAKYEGLKKKYKSELAEETTNGTFRTDEKPQASKIVSNASEQINKTANEFKNIFDIDNITSDVELRANQLQLANSVYESSNDNVQVKVEPPEPQPEVSKWTQPIQREKQSMLLAQQNFYEQENVRAQEKHLAEMELLKIKREKESKAIKLLDLQIAEKKRCIEVTNSQND
ncbi:hypothetical protein ACLKA7_015465 [Drosophila subpalustris]